MSAPAGLVTALNAMREMSVQNGSVYHQYLPIITEDTDINQWAQPILNVPSVQNEFMSTLINRIAYTQFENKYYRNPLQVLEGDRIPLGYSGQSIFVDRAKGRKYDVEDFAGLLQKYEAKVKVQYHAINMDLQYPVTVSRQQLKKAFVSWDNLNNFIDQLSNSLYNGAFIDEFRYTKNIVTSAFKQHNAVVHQITAPTTEQTAKDFITKARELYLNFQTPSTEFNAWKLVGDGEKITTWTNPEDILIIVRNDVRAFMDVNVLASSFNIDKATLMGNIISVDNFDAYDDDGTLIYDASDIIGIICDKSWFKIQKQDMFLDEFYNANNRTWQYYLNLIKMYHYSLFANGVIFATSTPTVDVTEIDFGTDTATIEQGEHEGFDVTVKPLNATTEITYEVTSGTASNLVLTPSEDGRHLDVKAKDDATKTNYVITATAGDITDTITITVA